jgi:ribose 5-phosphate isomerase RpiB
MSGDQIQQVLLREHRHDAAFNRDAAFALTMGARIIGSEVAKSVVDAWLASEFDPAGSSAENVKAIDKLDFVTGKPSGF